MTTLKRLAVAALALGFAGAPLSAASARGDHGDRGHHYGHWKGDHGYRYGPYAHYRYAPYRYRYAPVRYVYVRRPVYTRVIYDDDYYPYYYPRPYYSYAGYRYARRGVSFSVGYNDGPYYGGYRSWYPY